MATKVFSSYRSGKNKDTSGTETLVVEIATNHIACVVKSGSKDTIKDFELFKFEKELDFRDTYQTVFEQSSLLKEAYSRTQVFLNSQTVLLAPSQHLNKDGARQYLRLTYGEHLTDEVYVDEIVREKLSTVYTMSSAVIDLNRSIKPDSVKHTYSAFVDQMFQKTAVDGGFFKIIFYESHIVALLFKGKKLQIVQNFTFQSSEDILYYLFSIAERFDLDYDTTPLQLSGMVDVKSTMFNELQQRFKKITLEEADTKQVQINFGEYPKHYFTPFFNLAK